MAGVTGKGLDELGDVVFVDAEWPLDDYGGWGLDGGWWRGWRGEGLGRRTDVAELVHYYVVAWAISHSFLELLWGEWCADTFMCVDCDEIPPAPNWCEIVSGYQSILRRNQRRISLSLLK